MDVKTIVYTCDWSARLHLCLFKSLNGASWGVCHVGSGAYIYLINNMASTVVKQQV